MDDDHKIRSRPHQRQLFLPVTGIQMAGSPYFLPGIHQAKRGYRVGIVIVGEGVAYLWRPENGQLHFVSLGKRLRRNVMVHVDDNHLHAVGPSLAAVVVQGRYLLYTRLAAGREKEKGHVPALETVQGNGFAIYILSLKRGRRLAAPATGFLQKELFRIPLVQLPEPFAQQQHKESGGQQNEPGEKGIDGQKDYQPVAIAYSYQSLPGQRQPVLGSGTSRHLRYQPPAQQTASNKAGVAPDVIVGKRFVAGTKAVA